jgi:hypothetical protein
MIPLFSQNRAIFPAHTGVFAKKSAIRGSTPTNEATEKSRTSQPQDQGSSNTRQGKAMPGK